MRACTRLGVPLTLRGGGTSLSGQAVTDSVLVDTRTHFQGVEVLDDGARVRVEPGVTVRAVNNRLAPYRRRLGPDPASELACTIGGVIANNSSGMQCGTEFNTYRTLESMVLVLASGTVVDSAHPDADALLRAAEPELYAGLLGLRDRVRSDAGSVATLERLFSFKNTMGYGLNALLDHDDPVEMLVRLAVGSEGTLGFVASAVFRTLEVLPQVATGLLVFPNLHAAAASVEAVVATGVATAELLDAQSLRVAQADPKCPPAIRGVRLAEQAALLVELQAREVDELAGMQDAAVRAFGTLPLETGAAMTTDAAERAGLWTTRKGLYSAVAGARPMGTSALLEDVAVPVAELGDLSQSLVKLFDAHAYEGSVIFGHARDGNLHFMLNEDFGSPDKLERYEAFTLEMVDLVLGLGGTLKAEHGTGRIMAPFVERQYGAELTEVMRELKTLVDPGGMLNPGIVLTEDPRAWISDLKVVPEVEEEVDRCVECGFCEPVCPSRALTLTPRQRIVLRREQKAATQRGDHALAAQLAEDYDYDGVQTCAADGMCATVCPVHIDTGALVRRLRAESNGGLAERAWDAAAGHWGAATRAGSLALTAADKLPGGLTVGVSRAARRVAGAERVPEYDPGLGRGGAPRPSLAASEPDAVLFAACVQTLFGGGATSALVALCERAGVSLRTPDDLPSLCCGTPWKSKGHLDGHRRMSSMVAESLLAATGGGRLPVVVDASSCAEGVIIALETARAEGVTVLDATEFVASRVAPRLSVSAPVASVAVHPTCSSTALGSTDALVALARVVSDDVVVPAAWGCCAFAGDRGLLHPELTASATAPEAAELADRTFAAYVSGNRTCEIGMSRATGQEYRHVLEVLEEATR